MTNEKKIDKVNFSSSTITSSTCIETPASKDKNGYGRVPTAGQKHEYAHRLAYKIFKGSIPKGMVVMHSCDNPACCNPEHLQLGTVKDNVHDALQKGRRPQNPDISRKLDVEDVMSIRGTEKEVKNSILAIKYQVSLQTIRNIKKGNTWIGVAPLQGGDHE